MLARVVKFFLFLAMLIAGSLGLSTAALAANCSIATAQGSTGPADWQSYCWIDFSSYNDAIASSPGGQTFSLTLQDGTVMSFNAQVSGTSLTPVSAPSWSGAAVGNTAFLGISGAPILYQTGSGTTTISFSNIMFTPPSGGTLTQYMFVAGDGESTNSGESLSFVTNAGAWKMLDQAGPITGSTYPSQSGVGTSTFTETGVNGNVGAYIVGSTSPTTITSTLVGSGLQGAMFAVRFASLRLNTVISGARAAAADQFTFSINSTSGSTTLASGTSSGIGLGPFTAASLSAAASEALTLNQVMASGSTDTLAHYQSALTCTNSTSGSSTSLPSGTITTSYNFGTMQFGDNILCNYTETPFPHLQLTKALGASGRQYANDQFTLSITKAGTGTAIATTTTGGTGANVTNASTAQTQVTAGAAYRFNESGAGNTSLSQYTANLACINANNASTTTLPTSVAGAITPKLGDVVTCTLTNTKITANANLTIVKSSAILSDPINGSINAKSIPAAIVGYTFTVSNTGPDPVTNNSVFLVDTLPSQIAVGTSANPSFLQGSPSSGLTFNPATDIAFSNAATPPGSFAACTYTPVFAYDPAVRFVCLNPKGSFAGSTGTPPSFQLTIQAKIN